MLADAPRLARAGFTSPFGKIAERPIRNLRLPIAVEEELQRQASEIRVPFHEYVRDLLTIRAMGADKVKDAFVKRIAAIDGSEEEKKRAE